MTAISSYHNTLNELAIVRARCDYLINRKDALFTHYCLPKSFKAGEGGGGNNPQDNVRKYVIAITTPDEKTGMSIDEEIEYLQKQMTDLHKTLAKMAQSMLELDGIELQLYTEIIINGLKQSKAISKVARANYLTESAIYKTYLPKVREEINDAKRIMFPNYSKKRVLE